MDNYIDVPKGLTRSMLEDKFGRQAVEFYMARIDERRRDGRTYHNPLKTIYLWATQDRRTYHGYYTSYRGYASGRKHRNYGRS